MIIEMTQEDKERVMRHYAVVKARKNELLSKKYSQIEAIFITKELHALNEILGDLEELIDEMVWHSHGDFTIEILRGTL